MYGRKSQVALDAGFFESQSSPFGMMDCVGLYPYNPMSSESGSRGGLFMTPGISTWVSMGAAIYNAVIHKGELYVTTNKLWKISEAGLATVIGGTVNSLARLASNGETLMLLQPSIGASVGYAYFYDATNGLRLVTDPVFAEYMASPGGVLDVVSGKGYFFCCTRNTIFHSTNALDDDLGASFPALAFEPNGQRSDRNIGLRWILGDLYLFGETSYELWRVIDAEPFSLAQVEGATQDKGLFSILSVAQADNSFFFVGAGPGESLSVWRHTGGPPQKISTDAIDDRISSETVSFAFSYAENGQFFVAFRTTTTTLVYCVTASAMQGRPIWARRQHFGFKVINAYGKVLVMGSSAIGEFDAHTATEFGNRVERRFVAPYLRNMGNRFTLNEVELICESGVGLTGWQKPAQDSNPSVTLSYSDDRGETWKDKGAKPIGKAGEYKKIPRWRNFGQCSERRLLAFDIDTKAPVGFAELNVTAERDMQ